MAEKPLTNSINALTAYINEVTGGTDENLSNAIATLAAGYGKYSIDDIATNMEPSGDIIITASSVAQRAFSNKIKIKNVSIPNATTIESYAFHYCYFIETMDIPNVEQIGDYAFAYCSHLIEIYLPKLTNLSSYLFQNCYSMNKCYVPSVKTISRAAFSGCGALKVVKLPSCIEIGNNVFTASQKDIYLPNDASTYTGAPWGATNATIHYNTTFDENGEPVIE